MMQICTTKIYDSSHNIHCIYSTTSKMMSVATHTTQFSPLHYNADDCLSLLPQFDTANIENVQSITTLFFHKLFYCKKFFVCHFVWACLLEMCREWNINSNFVPSYLAGMLYYETYLSSYT